MKCLHLSTCDYAVASVSRIDKIIALFCKRNLWKRLYYAKETYNFIDPTSRSHPYADSSHSTRQPTNFPICECVCMCVCVSAIFNVHWCRSIVLLHIRFETWIYLSTLIWVCRRLVRRCSDWNIAFAFSHCSRNMHCVSVCSCVTSWHGTRVNESCHRYEGVMSQVLRGHATGVKGSCLVRIVTGQSQYARCLCVLLLYLLACHTYEWVTSHVWMNHATHMNESCHTYEWVMPHAWMRHATRMNASCHRYEWVMSRACKNDDTHFVTSCHALCHIMSRTLSHHVTRFVKLQSQCYIHLCVLSL